MAADKEAEALVAEFKGIFGIGPAFAKKLKEEGVGLRELADANEDDLDRWDVKLGLRGMIREHDWRQQAIDILSKQGPAPLSEVVGSMALKPDATDQLAEARETIRKLEAKLLQGPAVSTDTAPRHGRRPRTLDRRRKVSEIYPSQGYMQMIDGKEVRFDHADHEIGEGLEGTPEPAHKAVDPEDVNFINYLDGKQPVPFDLLRKAIKARWPNSNVRDEKKAYAFLHQHLRANA